MCPPQLNLLPYLHHHLMQQRGVEAEGKSVHSNLPHRLYPRPQLGSGETYLVDLLRGALGGGGGGRRGQPAFPLPVSIPVDQFAVGFLQGPLELVDAGLVLQQDILWLV